MTDTEVRKLITACSIEKIGQNPCIDCPMRGLPNCKNCERGAKFNQRIADLYKTYSKQAVDMALDISRRNYNIQCARNAIKCAKIAIETETSYITAIEQEMKQLYN